MDIVHHSQRYKACVQTSGLKSQWWYPFCGPNPPVLHPPLCDEISPAHHHVLLRSLHLEISMEPKISKLSESLGPIPSHGLEDRGYRMGVILNNGAWMVMEWILCHFFHDQKSKMSPQSRKGQTHKVFLGSPPTEATFTPGGNWLLLYFLSPLPQTLT